MAYMYTLIYANDWIHPNTRFYVRNVLTEAANVTATDLAEYVGFLKTNLDNQRLLKCEVIEWGQVPVGFNLDGLKVEDADVKPDCRLQYDNFFNAQAELDEYKEFIKQYVEAEKTRPAKFVKKSTATARVYADGYTGVGITAFAADTYYSELQGGTPLYTLEGSEVQKLTECKFSSAYGGSTFADFSKAFYSLAEYDAPAEKETKEYTKVLLKLSNGKQIEDRLNGGYWSTYLGTSLYPDLKVTERIAVYKGGIEFQFEDGKKLDMEMDLEKEEMAASVFALLTAKVPHTTMDKTVDMDKWKFGAKALAEFLGAVQHASYSQATDAYKKSKEFKLDTKSVNPKTEEVLKRRDVQKFLKDVRGSSAEMAEIQELCKDVADLYDIFRLFKEVHFLDSTNPKHVKMVLALKGQTPERQGDFVFQTVVQMFAETFLQKDASAKLASSVAWDSFNDFLKHPLFSEKVSVTEYGSQVSFNTTLKGLGFEQKRIASGKVWLGVKYVASEAAGVYAKRTAEQVVETARLLNVPVPSRFAPAPAAAPAHAILEEDNDDALSEEEQIGNEMYYENHSNSSD